MSEIEPQDFKAFVQSIMVVTKEEIGRFLHSFGDKQPSPNLTCKFYLIKCTADGFREADLIKFMCKKSFYYVLKKEQYQGRTLEEFRDLWIRVKDAFMKSGTTGEPGELLLFLLLEGDGILQLFSKMDIKTNGNIAFNGYDAVHVQADTSIAFHFGHSKMHADFRGALRDALNDVKKFNDDASQKDRELHLISSHIDESRFGVYSDKIRSLINPYSSHRELYREINSIFIGANWDLANLNNDAGNLDEQMKYIFGRQLESLTSTIGEKISAMNEIKSLTFVFYVLPFQDVEKFRVGFLKEIKR